MRKLDRLLDEKGIMLWWSDERDRRKHWVGIPDVACSRQLRAVAVPRRRRSVRHFLEVLHEVAHLLIWEETGKSPTHQSDLEACRRALALAQEYGFSAETVELCRQELAEVENGIEARIAALEADSAVLEKRKPRKGENMEQDNTKQRRQDRLDHLAKLFGLFAEAFDRAAKRHGAGEAISIPDVGRIMRMEDLADDMKKDSQWLIEQLNKHWEFD